MYLLVYQQAIPVTISYNIKFPILITDDRISDKKTREIIILFYFALKMYQTLSNIVRKDWYNKNKYINLKILYY